MLEQELGNLSRNIILGKDLMSFPIGDSVSVNSWQKKYIRKEPRSKKKNQIPSAAIIPPHQIPSNSINSYSPSPK